MLVSLLPPAAHHLTKAPTFSTIVSRPAQAGQVFRLRSYHPTLAAYRAQPLKVLRGRYA